jgi:DNA-binding MarR family transcriptional regulator
MQSTNAIPNLAGTNACASFVFRKVARAVTRFYDLAFEKFGIRSTQFTILVGVAKTQPTSIGSLSELLLIDPTTLTRTLQRLQKDGLIDISARSKMRQRFVTLTERGRQALARSLPLWRKAQKRFEQMVGQESWTEMRHELEWLARATSKLENSKERVLGNTKLESELLPNRLNET